VALATIAVDTMTVVSADRTEVLDLFSAHGAPLYRFCRAMLGSPDEAEDIVQDVFVKLLQHLEAGGDRSHLRAWLFTVAANACRDRRRWRSRWLPWRAELDDRSVDPPADRPDVGRARSAFAALPRRDRLLLSLRAQGLSYREIGAASGIRQPSVGKLLARAVDRWKRAVDK
jgi:RNA polymerase sigma-70 factor, ECF subfamily